MRPGRHVEVVDMPPYKQMGEVPPKRHTAFRTEDGKLLREEVFGTEGFEGVESILYHHHPPTEVNELKGSRDVAPETWEPEQHRHHHFRCGKLGGDGDPIDARKVVMYNDEANLAMVNPTEDQDRFLRNGIADELWFVREGEGYLDTVFGEVYYKSGDYIYVPRGTTYKFRNPANHEFYLIESEDPIRIPDGFLNDRGQLVEGAPYSERDLHGPKSLITKNREGEFELDVKLGSQISTYELDNHPFDVVGWDGYNYPFTFNISDYEPITGKIHQPPPEHVTFEASSFEVISWVPRKVDYHPDAIPAPYYHSNIDTDEVIFYVEGEFSSREGITDESMTIHRRGLHHGPQPGSYEGSIGVEEVDETSVMIEADSPFETTEWAKRVDDSDYMFSWKEE